MALVHHLSHLEESLCGLQVVGYGILTTLLQGSSNEHAGSLAWFSEKLKRTEPLSTKFVSSMLFLLWQINNGSVKGPWN